MAYIIIAIAFVIVFGILFRRKQEVAYLSFENLVVTSLPEIFAEDKNRNEEERSFVAEIINGHYDHAISNRIKNKSITRFRKWQEKKQCMFKNATAQQLALRNNYIQNKSRVNGFKHQYVQQSPCLPSYKRPEGWQLFFKDGFTEPFPTSPDMDDWGVGILLIDFFALHNISIEDSAKYVFHEKRHYVNHNLKQAIIQFDLYKKSA